MELPHQTVNVLATVIKLPLDAERREEVERYLLLHPLPKPEVKTRDIGSLHSALIRLCMK